MIGQSLSNTNKTCYSVQIVKIYNLNKAPFRFAFPSLLPRSLYSYRRSATFPHQPTRPRIPGCLASLCPRFDPGFGWRHGLVAREQLRLLLQGPAHRGLRRRQEQPPRQLRLRRPHRRRHRANHRYVRIRSSCTPVDLAAA